jgi:hypothetical protein
MGLSLESWELRGGSRGQQPTGGGTRSLVHHPNPEMGALLHRARGKE